MKQGCVVRMVNNGEEASMCAHLFGFVMLVCVKPLTSEEGYIGGDV